MTLLRTKGRLYLTFRCFHFEFIAVWMYLNFDIEGYESFPRGQQHFIIFSVIAQLS